MVPLCFSILRSSHAAIFEKNLTRLSHPTENGANKQENKRYRQQIPRYAEQHGLPPRQAQAPAQRDRAAALDNGEH